MRLRFAVALMLIAAPASAQRAPIQFADENASGETNQPLKAESPAAESTPSPDDPLSFLRRQRNKLKEFGITSSTPSISMAMGRR